jgi:hypothetical protein
MNWRALVAGLAFGLLTAPVFAGPVCTSTTDWAAIDTPIEKKFDVSHSGVGQHVDCFTFSPLKEADGSGHVQDFDPNKNQLDIALKGVELWLDGTQILNATANFNHFDFGTLQPGGNYMLVVQTEVSSTPGKNNDPVSFKGVMETHAVSEPSALALTGIALMAAGVALRHRRRAATGANTVAPAA